MDRSRSSAASTLITPGMQGLAAHNVRGDRGTVQLGVENMYCLSSIRHDQKRLLLTR